MQTMNHYSMIESSDHVVERGWRTSNDSSAELSRRPSAGVPMNAYGVTKPNLTPQKSTPADIRYETTIFASYMRQGAFTSSTKPYAEYQ